MCAAVRPQIHHIDENPSNNEPLNLLPLCPNHHLTDQHDPTKKIDAAKLRLFRRHKDPTILSPQFHPLFLRIGFLEAIDASGEGPPDMFDQVQELLEFIRTLKMGDFYSGRNQKLTLAPGFWGNTPWQPPDEEQLRRIEEYCRDYGLQLLAARDQIAALVVELLRYQEWSTHQVRQSAC